MNKIQKEVLTMNTPYSSKQFSLQLIHTFPNTYDSLNIT